MINSPPSNAVAKGARATIGVAMRRTLLVASTLWLIATCAGALAQSFPYKPVKLIAGHAPGGPSDTMARIVGPKFAELWGQPVPIENRVGAAGTIAAALVAKAPADGYTLLICSSSSLAFATVLIKDLSYDPVRDFSMIGRIASVPTVLALASRIPAKSVSELVAYARSHPGQLTAGSSGVGSSSGFALEMLNAAAGIDILQVPYGGLAPAVRGVLSGQVDMVFAEISLVKPHVESGAMRIIAAAGNRRYLVAPEVPTLQEQGFDDVAVDTWLGIVAPAGTPSEISARLTAGLTQVLRMPEVRQRLVELGYDPVEDTPELFAAAVRADIEKYSIVARRMRIRDAK
jgi:tripartite-type tricarboxylate transporter receptor subunit TctC